MAKRSKSSGSRSAAKARRVIPPSDPGRSIQSAMALYQTSSDLAEALEEITLLRRQRNYHEATAKELRLPRSEYRALHPELNYSTDFVKASWEDNIRQDQSRDSQRLSDKLSLKLLTFPFPLKTDHPTCRGLFAALRNGLAIARARITSYTADLTLLGPEAWTGEFEIPQTLDTIKKISPVEQYLYDVTIFEKRSAEIVKNPRYAGRRESYNWEKAFQRFNYVAGRDGAPLDWNEACEMMKNALVEIGESEIPKDDTIKRQFEKRASYLARDLHTRVRG